MKRAAVLATVLAALLAPALIFAHTNPARRAVAVQAEKTAVVLLVTWTVPSGELGDAYAAETTWGRQGASARKALETSLAAKAIAPLEITLDGKTVAPSSSIKLTEDPPQSGRLSAAVLLTAPVAAKTAHTLTVSIRPGADMTRAVFFDRTDGIATSDWSPEGDFLAAGHPLTVHWR